MAELTITRYRFRLARRGWVRGDAGRLVMAAARQRLPSLVAERLADVWTGGDDGDVNEPVRLRLRVPLAELAGACGSDETLAALVARLIPAETDAPIGMVASAQRRRANAISRRAGTTLVQDAPGRSAADVARVLAAWRARGDLAVRLESFTERALEDWLRALLGSTDRRTHSEVVARASEVETIVRAFVTLPFTTRADRLRRRIVAAVEAVARLDVPPNAQELARALEDLLPLPLRTPADTKAAASKRSSAPDEATGVQVVGVGLSSSSRATGVEGGQPHVRAIDSVLPFLLLRPLERLGYLDALAAAFAAAGRPDELPAFATALAYKVLAPPERGWRRDAASMEAAAAFAGRLEPLPETALSALADDAASLLSPLDGLVARALVDGHDPARPLLLVAAGGDRLLVEVDGLFPIAWNDGLDFAVTGCTVPIVVPAAAADSARLADWDARGLRFVTDAPPTRGERWRRLRAGRALWSNDARAADDVLARAAAALDVEEDALRLVGMLAARRASAFDDSGALDRSLALAAAAALGDLAWTLWREREPTSPELALLRFRDLSAQVRFLERNVAVRLPLGPRQRDLERHGFLGELCVPWLGTRTLSIHGA